MTTTKQWTYETKQEANRRKKDESTYTTPLLIQSIDAIHVTEFMSDFNRNLDHYETTFENEIQSNPEMAKLYHTLTEMKIPRKAFMQRYFFRCTDPVRIAKDLGITIGKGGRVQRSTSTDSSSDSDSSSDDDSSDTSSKRRRPQHHHGKDASNNNANSSDNGKPSSRRRPVTTNVPYRSSSSAWSKSNYRSSSRVGPSIAPMTGGSDHNDHHHDNEQQKRISSSASSAKPSSRRRPSVSSSAPRPSSEQHKTTSSTSKPSSTATPSYMKQNSIKDMQSTNVEMDTTPSLTPSTFFTKQHGLDHISNANNANNASLLRKPSIEPPALRRPSLENNSTPLRRPSLEHTTTTETETKPQIPSRTSMWERKDSVNRGLGANNETATITSRFSKGAGTETVTSRFSKGATGNETGTITSRFSKNTATKPIENIAKLSVMEKAAVFQQRTTNANIQSHASGTYNNNNTSKYGLSKNHNQNKYDDDKSICNSSISTTPDHDMIIHDHNDHHNNNSHDSLQNTTTRMVVDTTAATKELNARQNDDDSSSVSSSSSSSSHHNNKPKHTTNKYSSRKVKGSVRTEQITGTTKNHRTTNQRYSRQSINQRRNNKDEKTMYSVASTTRRRGLPNNNRSSRRHLDTSSKRHLMDRTKSSSGATVQSRSTTAGAVPSKRPGLTKQWGESARSMNKVKIPIWLQEQQKQEAEAAAADDENKQTKEEPESAPPPPLPAVSGHNNDAAKPKKSWKSKLASWQKRDTPDANKGIQSEKEGDSTSLLVKSKKTWSSKAFGIGASNHGDDSDDDDDAFGMTKKSDSSNAAATNNNNDDERTARSNKDDEQKKRKSKSWGVKPSSWGAKLPPWVKPGSRSDKNKTQQQPAESEDTTAMTAPVEEDSQSTVGEDGKPKSGEDPMLDDKEEEVSLKDGTGMDATGKSLSASSTHSSIDGDDRTITSRQTSKRWASGSVSKRRSMSGIGGMTVSIRQLAERSVVRAERRRNAAETYTRSVTSSKLTDEEAKEYKDFASKFRMRDWEDDIEIALVKFNAVAIYYKKFVPHSVEKKDFWMRYFFRCDEKRMLRSLRKKTSTGNRGVDRKTLEAQASMESQDEASRASHDDISDAKTSEGEEKQRTSGRSHRSSNKHDSRSVSPKPPSASSRRRPSNVGPSIRERQKSFERKHHLRKTQSTSRGARSSGTRDKGPSADTSTSSRDLKRSSASSSRHDPPQVKNGRNDAHRKDRSKDPPAYKPKSSSSGSNHSDAGAPPAPAAGASKGKEVAASPTVRRNNVRGGTDHNNSGVKDRIKAFSTSQKHSSSVPVPTSGHGKATPAQHMRKTMPIVDSRG